jgi:hypothetical protein
MGQTVGVAVNSRGRLFVYSRTNPQGIARGGKAAALWEFDQHTSSSKSGAQITTLNHSLTPCVWMPTTMCGSWTGKIYKLSLDGKVLGWAQTSLGHGEDDTGDLIHAIACPSAKVPYLGSASMWDVQKITIN